MKKIATALFTGLLISLLICGCGKVFHYEITSSPSKTTVKVMNASDGTYGESDAILVYENRILKVDSSLNKGKLQIDFAGAVNTAGPDESDDYIITGVVETVTVGPGEQATVTLEPGEYILQLTAIGDTEGTVTITIEKK